MKEADAIKESIAREFAHDADKHNLVANIIAKAAEDVLDVVHATSNRRNEIKDGFKAVLNKTHMALHEFVEKVEADIS